MSKVFFACDHAGYGLKSAIMPYVRDLGHEIEDLGAFEMNPTDDYPDFIVPCAKAVAANPGSYGITFGGNGQGEAMAANRVKGVRAAVFYGEQPDLQTDIEGNRISIVESERLHDNANILSIGARFVGVEAAKQAIKTFLSTPFSDDERHVRRLAKF